MLIRSATPDDYPFICETFLRSAKPLCTHLEEIGNGTIMKLPINLLANGWIASVVEHERLIAWAIHGVRNRLAWIYVRELHQREGVGRWMLGKIGVDVTKPIVTPFLPNRGPRRWRLVHRPFEVVPA